MSLGSDTATQSPPTPVRPPARGGVSMRPAMIVLGLAVLIIALFVSLSLLTSSQLTPVHTGGAPLDVTGSSLKATPAASALAPIISSGQPPANIVNAVDIPVGAVRLSHQNNAAESGQYDSQVSLRSDASQGSLLAFYASDMKSQGWQIFDRGPASNDANALEVLGKLAGTDGYYWEMGVTVQATSFGNGTPAAGATTFTVRLLQEPDPE
jgi:hypothetical protein